MKEVTVKIPEGKFQFFMDLIQNLGFDYSSASMAISDEIKSALDEAIDSINENGTIPHNQVMSETQKKYPNLFK